MASLPPIEPEDFTTSRRQLVTPEKRLVTNTFPVRANGRKVGAQHAHTMNRKLDSEIKRRRLPEHGSSVASMGPAVGGMTKRCAGAARYEDGEHPNGESRAPRLLPGYDSQTRRMEMGAFFLLGSVALTLVVLAAGNAVRFSENRDGIAAALSSGGVVVTSRSSAEETNHVLTNVTVIPTLGRGTPVSASQPVGHQS